MNWNSKSDEIKTSSFIWHSARHHYCGFQCPTDPLVLVRQRLKHQNPPQIGPCNRGKADGCLSFCIRNDPLITIVVITLSLSTLLPQPLFGL